MSAGSEASKGGLGVLIRKLATPDVPSILEILQESPEAAAWSQESLLQVASADPGVWVAALDGSPIGGGVAGFLIGRIAADEFEVLNMAVSRAHRRSGLFDSACDGLKSDFRFGHRGRGRVDRHVAANNIAASTHVAGIRYATALTTVRCLGHFDPSHLFRSS